MVTLMDCGTNHRATLTLIHLVFFSNLSFSNAFNQFLFSFHENIFLSGKNKLVA